MHRRQNGGIGDRLIAEVEHERIRCMVSDHKKVCRPLRKDTLRNWVVRITMLARDQFGSSVQAQALVVAPVLNDHTERRELGQEFW